MKVCFAAFVIASAVIFLGCGGNDGTATSAAATSSDRGASETTQAREPEQPLPKFPPKRDPLKKLVVRDLEVGDGPVAHWGDELKVRYVGAYWETKTVFTRHWGSTLDFKLDGKKFGPGWQKGIEGMRVGGRRELLIPAALIFGETDIAYVVKLDRIVIDSADPGR